MTKKRMTIILPGMTKLSRISKKNMVPLNWCDKKSKYDYIHVWQKFSQLSHVWQYSVWLLNLRTTKRDMTIKWSFSGYDHFFELQVWQKKNQWFNINYYFWRGDIETYDQRMAHSSTRLVMLSDGNFLFSS